MSTYADTDRCLDMVLNFIAGGVPGNKMGESAGNYNAVIGKINASDDLSKMNIDQINALQQQRLDAGMPSTAVGRYQFLRRTLARLLAKLKLSNSEKFTPELQDKLAFELLLECGYEQWVRGGIDNENFAHKLSTVWASLPDPRNDGKSHYDDDSAGNHASTTLSNFYSALRTAKMHSSNTISLPNSLRSPREFIEDVQRILIEAGTYPQELLDGKFGPKSKEGLNDLLEMDGQKRI